jgi:surfactin synthase thioesterase subunit
MFAAFDAMDGVEVHTVSHARSGAVGPDDGQRYLDEVVALIRANTDVPYALFGHSLGALFAWRVLHELALQAVPPPALYVPSSHPPTAVVDQGVSADLFSVVFPEAQAQGGDELRKRDFDADVSLWRSFRRVDDRPYHVPIRAFVGSEDLLMSESSVRRWKDRTTSTFSLTVLPGDHFYARSGEPRRRLLAEIARALEDARALQDQSLVAE